MEVGHDGSAGPLYYTFIPNPSIGSNLLICSLSDFASHSSASSVIDKQCRLDVSPNFGLLSCPGAWLLLHRGLL